MAGLSDAFNADEFRENIRATMIMGLTNNTAGQPKFIFPPTSESYAAGEELDTSGVAYDLAVEPTVVVKDPIQVPCALRWTSGGATQPDGSRVGDFEEADIVCTIMDEEYEQVKGAHRVEIDGTEYEIRFTEPSIGLFNVTVYQLHLFTVNQK